MGDRVCKRCQVRKPIAEFRKRRTSHNTMCRPCEAAVSLEYYHAHKTPEKAAARKAYNQEYHTRIGRTPETRQKAREEYYRNREKRLAASKANYHATKPPWRPREPFKEKCKALFGYAVKMGRIQKQPCSVCGALKVEGHHPDYFKPLEVIWLCRAHHAELHRKDNIC